MKVKVFVYIFFSLSTISFTSCGASSKVKESTEVNIDLEKMEGSFKQTKLKDSIKEIVFEPVNPSVPMVIGNDTIVNTRVIYRDRVRDSVVIERDTVYVKDQSDFKQDRKEKEVEAIHWNKLILALSIGGFIVIGANVAIWLRRKNV